MASWVLHKPPVPRKVGSPEEADRPAPSKAKLRFDDCRCAVKLSMSEDILRIRPADTLASGNQDRDMVCDRCRELRQQSSSRSRHGRTGTTISRLVASIGDVSECSPQYVIKVIRVCASEFSARVAD
jgi:hypothetical protein